jgi:3-hydroxyisobutyrate dehydrogenase-like beta-hydroxyacid dehydrogenase
VKDSIAIISAGDLGAALGARLRESGHRVLTTVSGRGEHTRQRAAAAQFEICGSLQDAIHQVDILISCVPPAQAVAVAGDIASLRARDSRPALYVDLNSIAPSTVRRVEQQLVGHGLTFADATIQGSAHRLADRAILFASGPGAAAVIEIFTPFLRTQFLGDTVGEASAMKMLLAGISKTLVATLVEVGCAAARRGMLDEFVQACRWLYPGVLQPVARMLPAHAQHAARRADEVAEIASFFSALGLQPRVVGATGQVLAAMAAASPSAMASPRAPTIEELLARFHAAGVCDEVGAPEVCS